MPALNQPLVGQIGEGSPHGDPRDAELVAQRLLGGQWRARLDRAPHDLVAEHQEELTVQRHPGILRRDDARAPSVAATFDTPPSFGHGHPWWHTAAIKI